LAVAVVAFGVSYGVLARTAHMGAFAPIVMSAPTFAGSAQFAVASILHDRGGAAAALAAAVLLYARYVAFGLSSARGFAGGGAGGCAGPGRSARRADRGGERRLLDRLEAGLSLVWLVVIAVGAATVAIKATGPLLLAGRELPPRLLGVVELLAPALLAALV